MSDVCPCGRLLNLLAGGAVAGAVGHEDEEIAVLQNLLRLLFVHRHEDNGFVERAVVRIGDIILSCAALRTIASRACYLALRAVDYFVLTA